MNDPKPFLLGLSHAELETAVAALGAPKFRARQIAEWLYGKCVSTPTEMRNLPATLQQALQEKYLAPAARIDERVESADGTRRLLLELADNECVELALIPSPERDTLCLSTQVGCPVRCRFCASGANGLTRNLAVAEMLEQFSIAARELGKRPDNLVFMGIGEGLLNFAALEKALFFLTDPAYFGLSPRRITVSTSGYVPGIDLLAALEREFTLAISLHAVDDATRAKLIPDSLRYPMKEILAAADRYRERAGRMVTLEYALLEGINDSPEAARELGRLALRHHAKINLIPYNRTGGEFRRPSAAAIRAFTEEAEATGATVTCRRERGKEADAACGQLRANRKKETL